MFRPNQKARLARVVSRDLHAREIYSDPVVIDIAVISLETSATKTTVRADSSASRGSAEETVVDGKILVSPLLMVQRGDRVEILGTQYGVATIHPRFDVWGKHDHQEIDLQVVL